MNKRKSKLATAGKPDIFAATYEPAEDIANIAVSGSGGADVH